MFRCFIFFLFIYIVEDFKNVYFTNYLHLINFAAILKFQHPNLDFVLAEKRNFNISRKLRGEITRNNKDSFVV